jgi:hypothetical protein
VVSQIQKAVRERIDDSAQERRVDVNESRREDLLHLLTRRQQQQRIRRVFGRELLYGCGSKKGLLRSEAEDEDEDGEILRAKRTRRALSEASEETTELRRRTDEEAYTERDEVVVMPLAKLSELSRDERGGEGSYAWKTRAKEVRAGRESEPTSSTDQTQRGGRRSWRA